MKSNNLFYNGETVPVKPSAAVLTEFMRNGWTQEIINHALSSKPWKNEEGLEDSPLEEYKGGVGYMFDWGHVIEEHGEPVDGVPCYASWEFCLDSVLSKAHKAGMNLGDLCDLCGEYFDNLNLRPWLVVLSEGAAMSCFCLFIKTTDESDTAAHEIEVARKWVAKEFLVDVLPDLLFFLENEILSIGISGNEALQ